MSLALDDYNGWEQIFIEGTSGAVQALAQRSLPIECWIRQRCFDHKDSGVPLLAPEWERFDPARHSGLIHPTLPLWTPDGIHLSKAWAFLEPRAPDDLDAIIAEAYAERTDPPAETVLYRWYAEQDRLLYVGITDDHWNRWESHTEGAAWMDFAVRSTLTRYPTRKEAATAEVAAIKSEKPLFNKQHNRTPHARARLAHFLVEQRRPDLLALAAS